MEKSNLSKKSIEYQHLPARSLLLLIFIVLMWGASYPAMKTAALEIPIFLFRGWTAVLPALLMLIIAAIMKQPLSIPKGCWSGIILTGVCTVTFTHTMTTFSTLFMPSGRTSILLYTMPIWAAVIAIPVLGERPHKGQWLGE